MIRQVWRWLESHCDDRLLFHKFKFAHEGPIVFTVYTHIWKFQRHTTLFLVWLLRVYDYDRWKPAARERANPNFLLLYGRSLWLPSSQPNLPQTQATIHFRFYYAHQWTLQRQLILAHHNLPSTRYSPQPECPATNFSFFLQSNHPTRNSDQRCYRTSSRPHRHNPNTGRRSKAGTGSTTVFLAPYNNQTFFCSTKPALGRRRCGARALTDLILSADLFHG